MIARMNVKVRGPRGDELFQGSASESDWFLEGVGHLLSEKQGEIASVTLTMTNGITMEYTIKTVLQIG